MKRYLLGLLVLLVVAASAASATTLTYVDLVNRLTDLEGLSVLPVPGETCAQWSSYERRSVYDAENDKYVGWDANADGQGVIAAEGDGFLLADIKGPGCIWRIWSATAAEGHVKIYLDGAEQPAVDLPFKGYFDRQNAPFIYRSLVHTTAEGLNNYVPIPFQKSCRITADKGWGNYYHFTYSTFPAGTVVPTFKRDLSAEETAALEKADRFLRVGLGGDPAGMRDGEKSMMTAVTVAPGQKSTVAAIDGTRAITGIRVKLAKGKHAPEVFRQVMLRMSWDGEKKPSVLVPLGDFFGTAPGVNLYKSLPLGMTKDGFYSYWYMPFADGAVVELINEGKTDFGATFTVTHAPLSRPVGELGRFHTKWHRDVFSPTEPERQIDWRMLQTEGRGRYCGVMLEVWNPRGGWWGEGDEKFYVDGERFPSTFGTGSEDYFGYAWCCPDLFQNCYHNQTRNDGHNVGHVSVNRWHIADNVPFQKSFEGDIEKYFPNNRPTTYAATAYWYLAPGGVDPYAPVPVKERTGMYVKPKVFKVAGALEGENLKVLSKSGGAVGPQGLDDGWSADAQLWWIKAQPGDTLVLALPVKSAGRYEVKLRLTKAGDYGICQFSLDGRDVGKPVDLYNPGIVPVDLSLGMFDLSAGEHQLGVRIVGANDKATKRYMFGLDCVKLEPRK